MRHYVLCVRVGGSWDVALPLMVDLDKAKHEAREYASIHGRENVRIKEIEL